MKTKLTFLFSIVIILTCCKQKSYIPDESLPSHPNEIIVSGAFALTPIMQLWIKDFQKLHPEVKFVMNTIGSGGGLEAVLRGKADLGMISSEIPKEIDTMLWVTAVARLGVVPIINNKNPYLKEIQDKGITKEDLAGLFSGHDPKNWGDMYGNPRKDPVKIYIREDASGASDVLAKYLWLAVKDLKGTPVVGEEKMIEAVTKDPLGLGYCNFIYAIDPKTQQFQENIIVFPLDLNFNHKIEPKESFYDSVSHLQRAMWLGKYPCGLIRDLYLVSKGKPNTIEVVEFLRFILTEGQKIVPAEGYIELHSSEIQNSLNTLKGK